MVDLERRKLFGKRLAQAMRKKGFKQVNIVEDSGKIISFGRLSHWLNGRCMPHNDELLYLARKLDVTLDWLSGRD